MQGIVERRPATSPLTAERAQLARSPRLGFVGVGWIGLHRLRALAAADAARIACIADALPEATRRAAASVAAGTSAPRIAASFERLLDEDLDGVVIATPSALHAEQASAALERGLAVFCQKPLARTAHEAARVIESARSNDRLLAVDFCYRTVAGVPELRALARSGVLGEIYAADLVFHNAYGPDKPWFYEVESSGGGCVMDLGIHLVDLLLWVLDDAAVIDVASRLYAQGRLLALPAHEIEDYACAELRLANGVTARLACSWRLPAGRDAVIEAAFYGTRGAAMLRNVGGSFYDFTVEHCVGTERRVLATPPDDWGGRAVCAWAQRLAADPGFDEDCERLVEVSRLIDAVYGR